ERRLEDLGTLGPKDLVEVRHVLRVTVADQELDVDLRVGDVTSHVPGLLGDPARMGVGGHAGNPDSSAPDVDKEQDVETLQQHRVHTKEVGGHDVRRLGTDELPPRGGTARCRSKAAVLHDSGNGAGRQPDTELEKLTLDAPIAPPGVLLGQEVYEGGDLLVHLGTARSVWIGPASGH